MATAVDGAVATRPATDTTGVWGRAVHHLLPTLRAPPANAPPRAAETEKHHNAPARDRI